MDGRVGREEEMSCPLNLTVEPLNELAPMRKRTWERRYFEVEDQDKEATSALARRTSCHRTDVCSDSGDEVPGGGGEAREIRVDGLV